MDGATTPLVNNTKYIQLVGSLLYLTHYRLDISYVVGVVFRYMQEPHELYWKSSKMILRYVKGIPIFGIHYAIEIVHWVLFSIQILIGEGCVAFDL